MYDENLQKLKDLVSNFKDLEKQLKDTKDYFSYVKKDIYSKMSQVSKDIYQETVRLRAIGYQDQFWSSLLK